MYLQMLVVNSKANSRVAAIESDGTTMNNVSHLVAVIAVHFESAGASLQTSAPRFADKFGARNGVDLDAHSGGPLESRAETNVEAFGYLRWRRSMLEQID